MQQAQNKYPHDMHDCCDFKVTFNIYINTPRIFAVSTKFHITLIGYVTEILAIVALCFTYISALWFSLTCVDDCT